MIQSMNTGIFAVAIARQIFVGIIGVFLTTAVVNAQTQVADDETFIYVVQPGDTLYQISERYLQDPSHWPGLARDAQLREPRHLQPGQIVRLPIDFLRHEGKEVRVGYKTGQVFVSEGSVIKPLTQGMFVRQGQTVETGDDGIVSLVMPDESKLLLSHSSRLRIHQFRYVPDVDKVLIDFVLEAGYVESVVAHQPDNSRFRVSTPLAVTGVRGTTYGVGVSEDGQDQTNDVTDGAVLLTPVRSLVRSAANNGVLLAAGQGSAMNVRTLTPQVRDLLPAADLSGWPAYVHYSSWMPPQVSVPGAAGYVVQVSSESDSSQVVFESRGSLETVTSLEDGKRYRVYVRALDSDGVPGQVSSHVIEVKMLPVSPLLQAPADKAFVALREQSLVCTNVPGVNRYVLQVAHDKEFHQIVDEQVSTQDCAFTFKPEAVGVYYWRAASMDESAKEIDAARGKFSCAGSFEVVNSPIAALAPEELGAQGIVLHWENAGEGITYLVQVSDKSDFSSLIFTGKTTDTQIALGISYSCSMLYVRLQSIAPNGVASEFSTPRILQTAQTWCTEGGAAILDGHGDPVGLRGH